MVLECYQRALSQMGDPRFRRVLLMGIGLTILLLIGATIGFFWLVQTLLPDTWDLPLIGPVSGFDTAAAIGSVFVMLVLSVFLMVPVASAFTGLFLEQIVAAVEVRHYPALPPATPVKLGDALIDAACANPEIVHAEPARGRKLKRVHRPAAVRGLVRGHFLHDEVERRIAIRRLGGYVQAERAGGHRGTTL